MGTELSRDDIFAAIGEALGCATEIALQYFRTAVPVDVKNDSTPVTLADREIEQRIRELLGRRFPECGVLGEEQGHSEGSGGTWVIDPIDGTKSFLLGNPLFGCLLGFVHNGKVEAGGLAMPALSENWIAGNGRATELNGKRVQTRNCTKLVEAALLTSSPDFFTETERARFEQVSRQVRYRRFGGDCYTYAMLAGGWCDLVVESSLFPFDYLPLVPIVEQAGGVISDWQGNPLGLDSGHQVIAAATQSLHEMAVSILDR